MVKVVVVDVVVNGAVIVEAQIHSFLDEDTVVEEEHCGCLRVLSGGDVCTLRVTVRGDVLHHEVSSRVSCR
jgi:hypothetical protein